jgi:hypothetical protein
LKEEEGWDMIVDPNIAATAKPLPPSGPLERQQPVEARPIEGAEGGLASRLDVQGEKNQRHPDVKDKDEKGNPRPMTYNARGASKKVSRNDSGILGANESIDLFV